MPAETEDEREARAADLETARDIRASGLEYQRGRREAEVDGRLGEHDKRFALINGSMEKHATNAARLGDLIEALDHKVTGIATTLATQAAVEAVRRANEVEAEQARRTAAEETRTRIKDKFEKRISNRSYALGIVAVCATIFSSHIGHFL